MPTGRSNKPWKSFSKTLNWHGRRAKFDFGNGPPARHAQALFERWKFVQQVNRERVRSTKAQVKTLDQQMARCCKIAEELMGAQLTAVGFARPPRGSWRRPLQTQEPQLLVDRPFFRPLFRVHGAETSQSIADLHRDIATAAPELAPQTDILRELDRQSGKIGSSTPGEQWDLNQLLESQPDIWRDGAFAMLAMIGYVADKLALLRQSNREAVLNEILPVATEHAAGNSFSRLEKLLILRVVLATLWSNHAAALRNYVAENCGPELSEFAFKHLTRVNLRIRPAVRMLEELRRLSKKDERERTLPIWETSQ